MTVAPAAVATPREHIAKAIALLSGEIVDGQWLGRPVGETYMLVPVDTIETIRARLYAAVQRLEDDAIDNEPYDAD